jgi:hypothetical protein
LARLDAAVESDERGEVLVRTRAGAAALVPHGVLSSTQIDALLAELGLTRSEFDAMR